MRVFLLARLSSRFGDHGRYPAHQNVTLILTSNPYKTPTPNAPGGSPIGSSLRSHFVVSAITLALFALVSYLSWRFLGADYAEGQVSFKDPTALPSTGEGGLFIPPPKRFCLIDMSTVLFWCATVLAVMLVFANFLLLLTRLVLAPLGPESSEKS